MATVLITGGAGYIGSHTVVALSEQGYDVLLLDNFSNSHPAVLSRIETIIGAKPALVVADIRDKAALQAVFSAHEIEAVVHFAGLKAVGDSVTNPLEYYDNNVRGSLNLLATMDEYGCYRMVFSSSATVYGDPASTPINEDFPLMPTNPYGRNKLMVEQIMQDLSAANDAWRIALLRYFNPVGAHPSGLIGEMPEGVPNNLMPYIGQVAVGQLKQLSVFGGDYPTADGTGVRDYIHVMDLAEAHVAALQHLPRGENCRAYNIGTGTGYSVLQMIEAFEQVSKVTIPYLITERRAGDVAICYANCDRSRVELGWQARRDLNRMMEDQWRWQSQNPDGYQ